MVAEGKPIKAIAAARHLPPEAVDAEVEAVFVKLAEGVSAGTEGALPAAATSPQGDRGPGGAGRDVLPAAARRTGGEASARWVGTSGRPSGSMVTVLMSDIRSYSTIAEHADPSQLAGQLNIHRAAMNEAILGENGTVMQFVGDAVMAVFGAPFAQKDHADRAVAAAVAMHAEAGDDQRPVGAQRGSRHSALGSGLSTGEAAAALLGSEERLEYTLVGDTVNMSQRLQQLAAAGEIVVSQATVDGVGDPSGDDSASRLSSSKDARLLCRVQDWWKAHPRPGDAPRRRK